MHKSFEDIKKAIVAAYPDCLDNKRLADELAMSQTSLNYFLFESRKLPTEYLIPWYHKTNLGLTIYCTKRNYVAMIRSRLLKISIYCLKSYFSASRRYCDI